MFISPASFNKNKTIHGSKPEHEEYRINQYEICNAVNTIRLGVILEKMVKNKRITKEEANLFELQAGILRASILTSNNRAFNL